jgi:hypothetical protein
MSSSSFLTKIGNPSEAARIWFQAGCCPGLDSLIEGEGLETASRPV